MTIILALHMKNNVKCTNSIAQEKHEKSMKILLRPLAMNSNSYGLTLKYSYKFF